MPEVKITAQMQSLICKTCGVLFFLHRRVYEARVDDNGPVYCPNGHERHLAGTTTEQHLRADLEHANEEAENVRHTCDSRHEIVIRQIREIRALKGVIKRMKNAAKKKGKS